MDIIAKLDWNLPDETQLMAMEDIRSKAGFKHEELILPLGYKGCWRNCAQLLVELPDLKLIPMLPMLMEWFQDMNWPGSQIILGRLKQLPEDTLHDACRNAYASARRQRDDEWMNYLVESFGVGLCD